MIPALLFFPLIKTKEGGGGTELRTWRKREHTSLWKRGCSLPVMQRLSSQSPSVQRRTSCPGSSEPRVFIFPFVSVAGELKDKGINHLPRVPFGGQLASVLALEGGVLVSSAYH